MRSKCDYFKIALLVGKVLEFKCLNQIFAITALSRKRGRKINSRGLVEATKPHFLPPKVSGCQGETSAFTVTTGAVMILSLC